MPINKNILEEYVDTFITYEKQTHGIDPRDTLGGDRIAQQREYRGRV